VTSSARRCGRVATTGRVFGLSHGESYEGVSSSPREKNGPTNLDAPRGFLGKGKRDCPRHVGDLALHPSSWTSPRTHLESESDGVERVTARSECQKVKGKKIKKKKNRQTEPILGPPPTPSPRADRLPRGVREAWRLARPGLEAISDLVDAPMGSLATPQPTGLSCTYSRAD
jgi:hypothetical protein